MTAPSLLDELEGVVKFLLGERPLDGRWFGDDPPVTASGMKRHYWWWRTDLRKAHADMAKRLEAAERDARRWRHVRSTAFREFELDHVWLRFAAIEQFDGPIHPLTEAWIDESVDRRIAATQEGEE